MIKTVINIHFQNGLSLESFKKEVFDIEGLSEFFDFEETTNPDFIVFGPYGNDIPPKGNYTRIGYFCENMQPDMSICEWAFGVPREEDVNHPNYKRIQWHGIDPHSLIKPANYNAEEIFDHKKQFCNFLYSHKVPYRETFFKALSKYKRVDAPGKSMNNMKSIDQKYKGNIWERKKQYLSGYKFTIAFENYVFPGYQTEKLYDAMQANSIPIYCGDPFIGEIFNSTSFINAGELIKPDHPGIIKWIDEISQPDFKDIRPSFYNNPAHRIKRKLKLIGKQIKMNLQLNKMDFQPVIEKIIELDQDDNKYLKMLKQPWFNNNQPPLSASLKNRWIEIFNSNTK